MTRTLVISTAPDDCRAIVMRAARYPDQHREDVTGIALARGTAADVFFSLGFIDGHRPRMPEPPALAIADVMSVTWPDSPSNGRTEWLKRRALAEISHATRVVFHFRSLMPGDWEIVRSLKDRLHPHARTIFRLSEAATAREDLFKNEGYDEATAYGTIALEYVIAYLVHNLSAGCWPPLAHAAGGVGACCYAWASAFDIDRSLGRSRDWGYSRYAHMVFANVAETFLTTGSMAYDRWQPGKFDDLDRWMLGLPRDLKPERLPHMVSEWAGLDFDTARIGMDRFLTDYIAEWNRL